MFLRQPNVNPFGRKGIIQRTVTSPDTVRMDEVYVRSIESRGRSQLLPIVADKHLPYLVPAITFWVISKSSQVQLMRGAVAEVNMTAGLTFHYIESHGLLSKYKVHTQAKDLTKNRASKWDVIKLALIQQAAQCTLGYWMADDQESPIPYEQTIAYWASMARTAKFYGDRSLPGGKTVSYWIAERLESYTSNKFNFLQTTPAIGSLNSSFVFQHSDSGTPQFDDWEIAAAKLAYWVLVPLCQYATAMVLADTMQYFTHRLFHVNKWLYSTF